jgi:hypothetical protein
MEKKRLRAGSQIIHRSRKGVCILLSICIWSVVASLGTFSLSPFSVGAVSVLAYLEYWIV